MSTKEWVLSHEDGASIYQECFYDFEKYDVNPNPAVIQANNPTNFSITREEFVQGRSFSQLLVEVPAKRFDQIALSWCKKRHLKTNEYSLDELLKKGTFKWPITEKELIDGLKEIAEDVELAALVKEREHQPEVNADLEMDNIFDVVTDDPVIAEYLRENSDDLIQLREIGRSLSKTYPVLSNIGSDHERDKALAILEILLEDYDNNLLLIDALSCAITRYEGHSLPCDSNTRKPGGYAIDMTRFNEGDDEIASEFDKDDKKDAD